MPVFSRPRLPRDRARFTTIITVVDAERVLRQAHRIEQHRALGAAVERGEALELRLRQPRGVADLVRAPPRAAAAQRLEPDGALGDVRLVEEVALVRRAP